jgi:hypothetical protein
MDHPQIEIRFYWKWEVARLVDMSSRTFCRRLKRIEDELPGGYFRRQKKLSPSQVEFVINSFGLSGQHRKSRIATDRDANRHSLPGGRNVA